MGLVLICGWENILQLLSGLGSELASLRVHPNVT